MLDFQKSPADQLNNANQTDKHRFPNIEETKTKLLYTELMKIISDESSNMSCFTLCVLSTNQVTHNY